MLLSDQQHAARTQLRQLATAVVQACPDMRQMARETAQSLLARFGHATLDPDQVILNRFHTAQSSPRTFSGWEHHERPYQSLTLPQLVMQRFDVQDQDNADLLGYLTGFYTEGAHQNVFDERNEIPIAPSDVLQAFWQIDFCTAFKKRLTHFWATQAEDFRVLAKANFLGKVLETYADDDDRLLAIRARQVAEALTGLTALPPSLEQLHDTCPPATGYRLCTFDIGGHVASDILRVELPDGGQFLYVPGEVQPLHYFADHKALYWWVLQNTNQAENRTRFLTHFPLASHAERYSDVGLHHLIDLLFFNWGGDGHDALNQLDTTLHGDAFDHLRDAMRQRMHDDADFALRSNADLRKQLWIGYLRAFDQVFGPMAAVDWPVALALVGAGLAETGLNVDQAINGHTTAERHAGVVGAVLAAIGTLFNATFLIAAGANAAREFSETGELTAELAQPEPLAAEDEAPATQAELETWVPEPLRPVQQQHLLAPFRTNEVLFGEPGNGLMAGVYLQDGRFYVQIDEFAYQVRYVGELRTWVVIDPESPNAFYRNVPLRRTEQGLWEPLERSGLKGGGLPRKALALWGRLTSPRELAPLPAQPYEIPEASRPTLVAQTLTADDRLLSGAYGTMDPILADAVETFRDLRNQLADDARAFLATPDLPPRPTLPALPEGASPKQLIEAVYRESQGLVVGEVHSQAGSKRFLIDNMAQLKKQKIGVLYLEHYLTDFHQADLDAFGRTGQMPPALARYVETQDFGHLTDRTGRYTFKQVLIEAQRRGIRLQAIDCMASYRQAWQTQPYPFARQKMMNFYAHRVIEADQLARGKQRWVALVGSSHANTFEGVPGVSELEGVVGLRVEDVPSGQPDRIGTDPGHSVVGSDLTLYHEQSDLRLQAALGQPPVEGELEQRLDRPGTFSFISGEGDARLAHRSKDGSLKFTPIQRDGSRCYLQRPEWPQINERRYEGLAELRTALRQTGMQYKTV